MFQPGDRVRWETTGDDGLPLVRYGFVGGCNGFGNRVAVMFDGQLKGDTIVELDQLAPVTITNVELRLHGADLLDDPSLRQGLVSLWSAEADQAGLEVRSIQLLGTGVRDTVGDGFALAELHSGGQQYVLRALYELADDEMVCVKADFPRRWELR
jgi:hypothetical protein